MPANGAAASYGDLLVTSLVVLGGVCIAAFVVVKLVGRLLATGRVRGAHLLDVVARLPLEPRRSLYVVEVAGKTLLVGTSEMGLSVLSELDGAEVRARTPVRQGFGDLVRAAWVRRRGGRDDGPIAVPDSDAAPGGARSFAAASDAGAARTTGGTDRSSPDVGSRSSAVAVAAPTRDPSTTSDGGGHARVNDHDAPGPSLEGSTAARRGGVSGDDASGPNIDRPPTGSPTRPATLRATSDVDTADLGRVDPATRPGARDRNAP